MTIDDDGLWPAWRVKEQAGSAFDVVGPQPMSAEERHLYLQGLRARSEESWAEDTGNPKDRIGDTKPPLHLVPAALDIYASLAMKNGADKYGPFNWREKPVRAEVYIAAARRHLAAWFDGEDVASDSGVHHLAHAAAGLAILLDAMATGNLIDDRPVAGPASRLIAEFTGQAA